MTRFTAINLASLSAPDVVETLDFNAIKAELIADVDARFKAMGINYNVGTLESDPVVKVLEVAAYREMLLRARVNDAARAVLLATALGNDLDHLGALYSTPRFDGEDDDVYRERVQLAPEAFSTCGPVGAYIYHARAVSIDVRDANTSKPQPGYVHVYIMSTADDGVPSAELLAAVAKRFRNEDLVPFTDVVAVLPAAATTARIDAVISAGLGPDPEMIRARAIAALRDYLLARRRIGLRVAESGIKAALSVQGVETVMLREPTADIVPPVGGYVLIDEISITIEVNE